MTWRRILPILIATLVMGFAYAGLFNACVRHDDTWGRTTIVREWGVEREVRMDRDLDGRTDVRIRYPGSDRQISNHDRPSEIWIDSDLDGVIDLHWADGDPPVLEERLADGRVRVVRGEAAQIRYDRGHSLHSCLGTYLTAAERPGGRRNKDAGASALSAAANGAVR